MKKILIPIILIITVSCIAQDPTYNLARDLYETHNENIDIGRRAIENTENNTIQASYALLMALLSSSQGYPVDSSDYWKGVFDGIVGETTAELVLSWDAVLVLDRDMDTLYLDSISFNSGVKWINNPMDSTDIIDFNYDTLYFSYGAIKQVSSSVMHIVPTTDRSKRIIIANNASPYGVTLGGLESLIFSGKDDYMMDFKNDSTRASADTTHSWSAQAIRNYIDPIHDTVDNLNTRILANIGFIEDLQDSSDKHTDTTQTLNVRILANLGFIEDLAPSGNQYVLQMSNGDGTFTSDGDYTIQSDSARFKNLVLSSELRLTKWGTTDTAGLYKLPNGEVDTMEWSRSSWASHKENIEPFDVFFKNRDLLGELNWPRWKDDSYHRINPRHAYDQFTVAHERTWVYIEDLYNKNKELEDRINILEWIIREKYKLSKRQLRKLQ